MKTDSKEELLEKGEAADSAGPSLGERAFAAFKAAANDVGGMLVGSLIFLVSRGKGPRCPCGALERHTPEGISRGYASPLSLPRTSLDTAACKLE